MKDIRVRTLIEISFLHMHVWIIRQVWISATVQVMFSLGLASGTTINYSSFSMFKVVVVVSGTNARPLHKSDEQQHMVSVTLPITSI
jgi:hypothetical protein